MTTNSAEIVQSTGELLECCRNWVRRFIVMTNDQALICSFWELHTYVLKVAVITPYLHIISPEKESGKTRLLNVLKLLAYNPRFTSNISSAALARCVDKVKLTLFIDELDGVMKGDQEKAQTLRCILDSGFEVDGTYTRCVGNGVSLWVKDFSTFCPKAFASIGRLWDTVESRSIRIEMRRKLPTELVESFRKRRALAESTPIQKSLQAWGSSGAKELLEQIVVDNIPGFGDRLMDISEPLLQIAQLAGGEWPQKLIDALRRVFNNGPDEDSIGADLLGDIKAVFEASDADEMVSSEIAERLCDIEGRPWAEWSHGRGLTPNSLARLLKPFRIHPTKIRFSTFAYIGVFQGYRRADFEDAWLRYCPHPQFKPEQLEQPASLSAETAFSNRNTDTSVPVAKSASDPHEQRGVPVVPVQNQGEDASELRV
jgi:hypothetical protein